MSDPEILIGRGVPPDLKQWEKEFMVGYKSYLSKYWVYILGALVLLFILWKKR